MVVVVVFSELLLRHANTIMQWAIELACMHARSTGEFYKINIAK